MAIFAPIAGGLADRFGRRPVILAAAMLYIVAGVAPFFLADLKIIMGARFVVGIAEAAMQTLGYALLGDYFKGKDRVKWITWQVPILSFAAAAVTTAIGVLAGHSWRYPFAFYGVTVLMLLAIWLFIWEPPKTNEADPSLPEEAGRSFPWGAVLFIAIASGLSVMILVMSQLEFGFVLRLSGFNSPAVTGLGMGVMAIVGVWSGAFVYNRLVKKGSIPLLLATTYAVGGLGLIGMGTLSSLWGLLGSLYLVDVGFGVLNATIVTWALKPLTHSQRGLGMGIWVTMVYGAQFLSPMIVPPANVLTGGLAGSVRLFGAVLLAAMVVSAILYLRRRGSRPVAETLAEVKA
jgi:MFS family permease